MIHSSKELALGQYVKSRSGRDKDKVFIVIGIIDDQFVYIADGDLRKLEKPKKKKIKHLAKLSLVSQEVKEKLENDMKFNNAFLRKKVEKVGLI